MALEYTVNRFNGGEILSTAYSSDGADGFITHLQETIAKGRDAGLRLLWLHLPPQHSELVPLAVAAGFEYHHADPNGLQLVFKVQSGAFVPEHATHYIGVGGVVLDDQNRLLVIQERHHKTKHLKLPGGAVDPKEHLADAAVREVLEETGIRCRFTSLHCFRHWHGYRFGKSDIYFVCRLEPLNFNLNPDLTEITEARWMPLEEYLGDPDTHPFNRKIVTTTVNSVGLRIESLPGYGSPETHELMFSITGK